IVSMGQQRRLGSASAIMGLACCLGAPPASADPVVGNPVQVTNLSPLATCTADKPETQGGTLYPNTEIEPWVDLKPQDPRNIIVGYQQDRWSNGGARGLVAGVSKDAGATWTVVPIPLVSLCTKGTYDRASDPWVSFGSDGTAYFMSLAFD